MNRTALHHRSSSHTFLIVLAMTIVVLSVATGEVVLLVLAVLIAVLAIGARWE